MKLENFGNRELRQASKLLEALIEQECPIYKSELSLFLGHDGNVYLTNDDYELAGMNGNKLDKWHYLPYSGEEGYLKDLLSYLNEYNTEDREYLKSYL